MRELCRMRADRHAHTFRLAAPQPHWAGVAGDPAIPGRDARAAHRRQRDLGPPPSALTARASGVGSTRARRAATAPPARRSWIRRGSCRATVLRSVVVWGFVNRLPRPDRAAAGFGGGEHPRPCMSQDDRHFLLMLSHDELKPWLQDLVLYYGAELKGLLQIFPTTGRAVGADGRHAGADHPPGGALPARQAAGALLRQASSRSSTPGRSSRKAC